MVTELAPGMVVAGRYRVDRLLGRGGMGVVWAVTHTVTRKAAALKVLAASSASNPLLRKRFMREARAATRVAHPNLAVVHDVFELDDATPVMIMELLEGETLEARLTAVHKLDPEACCRTLLPIVSAVGTIHAHGIVHRDLKPSNIFLARAAGVEIPKVLDFGIAKLLDPAAALESGVLTDTGSTIGTPFYMAPEQVTAEKHLDHRTDIWSLGVILFECLSGTRPVKGENLGQIIKLILVGGMPDLFNEAPGVPEDLGRMVQRMLAIDPNERPRDLREVMSCLAAYDSTPVPAFGPPTFMAEHPSLPPPAARHRVVTSRDADSRAATVQATSGDGASTDSGQSLETARGAKARVRRVWVVGAAALVAGAATFAVLTLRDHRVDSTAAGTSVSAAAGTVVSPAAPTHAASPTAEPPRAVTADVAATATVEAAAAARAQPESVPRPVASDSAARASEVERPPPPSKSRRRADSGAAPSSPTAAATAAAASPAPSSRAPAEPGLVDRPPF